MNLKFYIHFTITKNNEIKKFEVGWSMNVNVGQIAKIKKLLKLF